MFVNFKLFTTSEEFHCVLEMITSTLIVFIITLIIILIANVLISYLFVRHQKKKFMEQLQAISEAIPEGKGFTKPKEKQSQGKNNQIEQHANNARFPANASLPYYSTVRPNSQTHVRNVHLETNPAYF